LSSIRHLVLWIITPNPLSPICVILITV
jgi:hypothetical protein